MCIKIFTDQDISSSWSITENTIFIKKKFNFNDWEGKGGCESTQITSHNLLSFFSLILLQFNNVLSSWVLWPWQEIYYPWIAKKMSLWVLVFNLLFMKQLCFLDVSLSSLLTGKNPLSSIYESTLAPGKLYFYSFSKNSKQKWNTWIYLNTCLK